MRLPPRWIRRLLFGPILVGVVLLGITSLPVWAIIAAFASRFVPGRWRPLRLAWFGLVWFAFEAVVLVALFGLWVFTGFGWRMRSEWSQTAHYGLMAWFLGHVVGTGRRTFGLTLDVEWSGADSIDGRPLLVFARHAGPGDSLLIVDALMNSLGRRPRVVLKDVLQWDPAIDTLLNRLPSRFITPGSRTGSTEAIHDLAASMGATDALVIFPEGGNFTAARRRRAIEKLEGLGRQEFAQRARDLEYLLPPQVGGVIAAVSGAPTSIVGLVGHVGLDHMETPLDIWDGLVMDRVVYTRVWFSEAGDLPTDRSRLEVWLFDAWEEMDTWITAHRDPQ
ncbi:MAG TPA: 1-acyl-sn-glycerol-3-phosphate acyltransferase [Acidimicrobiia bacterium]|nr:1-acyl-sn-glycerol-3-phosphate acyltransferase [Acidimicrobiia bacterium]